jgi:hypothetical protein
VVVMAALESRWLDRTSALPGRHCESGRLVAIVASTWLARPDHCTVEVKGRNINRHQCHYGFRIASVPRQYQPRPRSHQPQAKELSSKTAAATVAVYNEAAIVLVVKAVGVLLHEYNGENKQHKPHIPAHMLLYGDGGDGYSWSETAS